MAKETENVTTINVNPFWLFTIIIVGVLVVCAVTGVFTPRNTGNSQTILANNSNNSTASVNAVTIDSTGKQILEVKVAGGYSPSVLNAKAGVPTILRLNSQSALGCERAFRIPALGIYRTLPSNGVTELDLGSQSLNTLLRASCSMGMYSFIVNFQ